MKRAWSFVEVLFALVAIATVGVFLAYAWPHQEKPNNIWEILTAVGTVGAVVVGVSISLRDARWRREGQEAEARIAWGIVANEVRRLRDDLRAAKLWVSEWRPSYVRRGFLANTPPHDHNLDPGFPSEVLYKLAYLPSGVGAAMAGALGHLPGIRTQMKRLQEGGYGELIVAKEAANKWIDQAIANLDYVINWADSGA